ncbi:MAG: class I SAM-dependent methyltransferase [Flavobacteriales bacterium]|nr:class I SAM-dependent methyltransferase [Flavobacteriales bacterium]
MDPLSRATNLQRKDDGIHYAKVQSRVSYPEDGNDDYLRIEDRSFWFRHRNDIIIAAIRNFHGGGAFFDIGGGNGFVAKGIQDAGYPVVLVEPGPSGARNAKARGIEHVACSTLQDAGFPPERMEAMGLFDVLEHIEDDLGFLKLAHGHLKPGGRIYISVPAYGFLWSNEDEQAGHFRRYTLGELRKVLTNAGFSMTYGTYFFSPLPLPIFLMRSIPSRLGSRRGPSDRKTLDQEHRTGSGPLDRVMRAVWAWEKNRVAKCRRIPFGSSCFMVATK